MQTKRETDQDWVGPDLPSLSGVVFGSILFVTGMDAHHDGDRGTVRDPAVRYRARLDADAEGPHAVTIAAATRRVLRRQGMPRQEIRAVLAANDPLLVRRLLELHRERLEEWLEEQRRLVANIEQSLAGEPGPMRSEDMLELAARSCAGGDAAWLPRMGTR